MSSLHRLRPNSGWWTISVVASLATCTVLGGRYLGLLQSSEWAAYDQFLRWHAATLNLPPDERIKIVTIDEADLHVGGQTYIPDELLAQVLRTIAAQQPTVIGLDLYRDLPVPPGEVALQSALADIPNIVGIQKVGYPKVAPPAVLNDAGRAVANDFMLDGDHRVRRSFLFVIDAQGDLYDAFAPYLAMWWLEERNIYFEKLSDDRWRLGAATFDRFGAFDGGYIQAETGGYQLLINYRGSGQQFETIPFREVIAGNLPPDWAHDCIVLIGNTAESSVDLFATPLSGWDALQLPIPLSGVEVQAHIIAQVLDAAAGDRPLMRPIPESVEILWISFWSTVGAVVMGWGQARENHAILPTGVCLSRRLLQQIGIVVGLLGGLIGSSYLAFTQAIWIPTVPAFLGFILGGGGVAFYTVHQVNQLQLKNENLNRLANIDGLTQVANRRSFDAYLHQACAQAQQRQQSIALILCDVDYFKRYNDTYGHQAGDDCLQRVAQTLSNVVKQPGSLVARYGGEEFAIVLPRLQRAQVEAIAATIQHALAQQAIAHRTSGVSPALTLSMGIAVVAPNSTLCEPTQLMFDADQALYKAKQDGRDRYCSFPSQT